MKIIFFGTPKFASNILEYLKEKDIEILAVVTQSDKINNKRVHISEVKKTAQKLLPDIDLLQPIKASEESFIEKLKSYNADLFVVAAYGQILKQKLLDIPKLGCINVHASLLPKYRGAAPIQYAILNGEKVSGITIMKMALKMDAGDIIDQKEVEISDDMVFTELEQNLCTAAKPLLLDVIKKYEKNDLISTPQDETKVTYAHKITSEDRELNFEDTSINIYNRIRAFALRPGAYCKIFIDGDVKKLKILKSKILDIPSKSKEIIIQDNSLVIGTLDKALELIEVQLEGKRPMQAPDFIRGLKKQFSLC